MSEEVEGRCRDSESGNSIRTNAPLRVDELSPARLERDRIKTTLLGRKLYREERMYRAHRIQWTVGGFFCSSTVESTAIKTNRAQRFCTGAEVISRPDFVTRLVGLKALETAS